MRRVLSETSRGRARPFKCFCPPLTHSPHSNLSRPPSRFRRAANGHLQSLSVWQSGDASCFLPLLPVPSSPVARVIGDTFGSLPQPTGPVPATFLSSTSVPVDSLILNEDAKGFPSWWTTSPPQDLLDTPTQVCLLDYNTLLPLSHFFHEWERLPGVSPWILHTIRSGYTLKFGRNPPRFDGVHLTVVSSASKASVLQQELSSLLLKGAIEEIPQSDLERGFFSRYFLVPKRDGGLRPILDLRCLNLSFYKGKFKMLTLKTILSQIQVGDWFVTIDLKDAYFHIQVVRRHRKFLRFTFGGKVYQYRFFPLAWPWLRGRSQSAWMLLWPP